MMAKYMLENFFASWMMNGMMEHKENYPEYSYTYQRYPALYVISSAATCVFGPAVVLQDILSHVFGQTYRPVVSPEPRWT